MMVMLRRFSPADNPILTTSQLLAREACRDVASLTASRYAPSYSFQSHGEFGSGYISMSCENIHGATPRLSRRDKLTAKSADFAARWQRLMLSENVDYAEYRDIFGVCDNTARSHLDHARREPTASMIALAISAFGLVRVVRALWLSQ